MRPLRIERCWQQNAAKDASGVAEGRSEDERMRHVSTASQIRRPRRSLGRIAAASGLRRADQQTTAMERQRRRVRLEFSWTRHDGVGKKFPTRRHERSRKRSFAIRSRGKK